MPKNSAPRSMFASELIAALSELPPGVEVHLIGGTAGSASLEAKMPSQWHCLMEEPGEWEHEDD